MRGVSVLVRKDENKCIISPNRDPFEWGIEKYLQAREEEQ